MAIQLEQYNSIYNSLSANNYPETTKNKNCGPLKYLKPSLKIWFTETFVYKDRNCLCFYSESNVFQSPITNTGIIRFYFLKLYCHNKENVKI